MKNLSRWAKNNPAYARIIIALAHVLVVFNALLMGLLFYTMEIGVYSGALILFANLFLLTYFFYPKKKEIGWFFKNAYARQKSHDFFLIVFYSAVLAFGGNNFLAADTISPMQASEGRAELMSYRPYSEKVISHKQTRKERIKSFRKQIKHELRTLKKEFKQQDNSGKKTGLKILLIVLTVVVALGLGTLIAGLACSASCSGQEGLAAVILLLGWTGIVWLSVIAIKNIVRKIGKPKAAPEVDS